MSMYSAFFGFDGDPFGVSPDPRFFFPSQQHAEALASLRYALLERRAFTVLIGKPGLGKTSILVNLASHLTNSARVAFIVDPVFGAGNMLASVLFAMGLNPEADPLLRLRQLQAFLSDLDRSGKSCVIVIDEAQHLDVKSLEAIRMLSNFETPTRKLIQFVLAGQPGLADLLNHPDCEQIRQRINVVAKLHSLTYSESEDYIGHRLTTVGAPRNPFTSGAMRAIASASQGIPRNINTLCFNALTLAFACEHQTVTESLVSEVVADLHLGCTPGAIQQSSIPYALPGLSSPPRSATPARSFLFGAAAALVATAASLRLI